MGKDCKTFGYQGDSGAYADRYEILKNFSRTNRQNPTAAEYALWQMLSSCQLGTRFRRQHIIGDYIVDFVSLRCHLIVELDGKYHNRQEQQQEDEIREHFLSRCGYRILRFTNEQVYENPDGVAQAIKNELEKVDK